MSNVSYRCFIQPGHSVSPGEWYAVRAYRKIEGEGVAFIRISWRWEGLYTAKDLDRLIYYHEPRDDWSEIFVVVQVPQGVDEMVIKLFVTEQRSSEDLVWFDDVGLSPLPLPEP